MVSLNRQEKQVVLFFAAVVLSGIGISYCAKTFAVAQVVVRCSENIGKIDVNKADASVLESARGIGPVLARRIIAYRTESGRFKSIEDLQKVKGMTRYRFDKIKGAFIVD